MFLTDTLAHLPGVWVLNAVYLVHVGSSKSSFWPYPWSHHNLKDPFIVLTCSYHLSSPLKIFFCLLGKKSSFRNNFKGSWASGLSWLLQPPLTAHCRHTACSCIPVCPQPQQLCFSDSLPGQAGFFLCQDWPPRVCFWFFFLVLNRKFFSDSHKIKFEPPIWCLKRTTLGRLQQTPACWIFVFSSKFHEAGDLWGSGTSVTDSLLFLGNPI